MATSTTGSESDVGSLWFNAVLCLMVLLIPVAALVEAGTVAWCWVLVGALVNGLVMGFGPSGGGSVRWGFPDGSSSSSSRQR